MYGLPENFRCDFFLGRRVVEVCIAAYTIFVHFDRKVLISIRGAYAVHTSLLFRSQQVSVPEIDLSLFEVIGRSVMSARAEHGGTLSLRFDNELLLQCFDDPHYESYVIQNGKKEIIV
jgi:hypothetical protein